MTLTELRHSGTVAAEGKAAVVTPMTSRIASASNQAGKAFSEVKAA